MERQRKSIPAEWKFYKEYSFIDFLENMAKHRTDGDIISWLQRKPSKQGAMNQLIRENLVQTGK